MRTTRLQDACRSVCLLHVGSRPRTNKTFWPNANASLQHARFPTSLHLPTMSTHMFPNSLSFLRPSSTGSAGPKGRRAVRVSATTEERAETKQAAVPTVVPGARYDDLQSAVNAGLVVGYPPFIDGIDVFGFFNDIKQTEAQRYADVEITHGRVAMLAALGFLVGEQVEGRYVLGLSQIPALFTDPL